MSSHIETGVTWLWLAQQGGLAGTSVSVMKPLTAFVTEERWSQLWGKSSAELSALGRTHMEERGRETASWSYSYGGVCGRVTGPRHMLSLCYLGLPCSCGISFRRAPSPSSPPMVSVKCASSDWRQTSRNVTCRFLVGTNTYEDMFAVMLWERN